MRQVDVHIPGLTQEHVNRFRAFTSLSLNSYRTGFAPSTPWTKALRTGTHPFANSRWCAFRMKAKTKLRAQFLHCCFGASPLVSIIASKMFRAFQRRSETLFNVT